MKKIHYLLLASVLLLVPIVSMAQINDGPIGRGLNYASRLLVDDGSATLPAYGFASEPTLGFRRTSAQTVYLTDNTSATAFGVGSPSNVNGVIFNGGGTSGVLLANLSTLAWTNGTEQNARDAVFWHTAAKSLQLDSDGAGAALTLVNVKGPLVTSTPSITAGAGTGITVTRTGLVDELLYTVTIDKSAFVCAAVTCDVTIATLPAKTLLLGVIADQTTVFACSTTCTTSTLSFVLGRGAGGAQFLASWDADAATGQFGDADAELGTTMVRASAVQGGSFESWGSTQAVVLRLTSGTGNVGTGAATNLSTGSVTFYLTTRVHL